MKHLTNLGKLIPYCIFNNSIKLKDFRIPDYIENIESGLIKCVYFVLPVFGITFTFLFSGAAFYVSMFPNIEESLLCEK